jgi:hypothetical protein
VYRASQPLLLAGVERDCEVNAKETTGRPTQGGSLRSVVLKCAGSVIDGRVAAGAYHSPPRDVGTVIRHCLPDRTGGPRTECGGNPAGMVSTTARTRETKSSPKGEPVTAT